jgi:hypothetical protein
VHSIYTLSSFGDAQSKKYASLTWEVRKVARGLASLYAAAPAATPAQQFVSSYPAVKKSRVAAFNMILGTPIVTRAHKWRAWTANSDLTPNSAQEAAQQVSKEDAAHHARMKAQQRDILKNLLQK